MTVAASPNLRGADWLGAPSTQAVFDALEMKGFTARVVGGAVRNSLLGLSVADVDLATDAPPDEIMACARAAGLSAIPTGIAHGTVTVIAKGRPFEVTTLRRDLISDGRHAQVAFTQDWAADAGRRDFTINALYCSREGEIFDPLGGLVDIKPVRIRFIGDPFLRVREDYLRILRFFRFSATYVAGGRLDEVGLAACVALKEGLRRISGERIREELLKLLVSGSGVATMRTVVESGVFGVLCALHPRTLALQRLAELETLLGLEADGIRRLTALALTKADDVLALDRRLKFARRDRDRMMACVRAVAEMAEMSEVNPRLFKQSAYRWGLPVWNDALLVWSARQDQSSPAFTYRQRAIHTQDWMAPTFPLTGGDLIAVGAEPGPRVGEILRAVEAEWIEANFTGEREHLLKQAIAKLCEVEKPGF